MSFHSSSMPACPTDFHFIVSHPEDPNYHPNRYVLLSKNADEEMITGVAYQAIIFREENGTIRILNASARMNGINLNQFASDEAFHVFLERFYNEEDPIIRSKLCMTSSFNVMELPKEWEEEDMN
jgi:hypothetical protein